MDRGRRRDPGDEEPSELDKEEVAGHGGGLDAPVQNDQDDAEKEKVERVHNTGQRVRLSITARRVRINPVKKRRRYIRRLERLMQECDRIISDPEGYEEIQVKAMSILIRAINVCYMLVTDEQVEELEREFAALKKRIAKRDRKTQPPS